MKIELSKEDIARINGALDVKIAALKRAANTEKDPEVKELREKANAQYQALYNKLNTQELPIK